ncbi:myelin-oligodendrocyte glycoprotein-like [Cyprinodon tularosa]|uniref:myelin-oligodendrocyte glycoprotein-like n=1 Tax=Cyprinodon tularosa TaxID=77115 RepID=UPI0018E20A3B|nr:myelin-oligodendrocyte glycoprotein-like [Cyprinodon tularosa]
MKLFAAFFFLLYASQDSLTVKLEVQEGAPSVLLPCHYSKVLEEIVTVKWSRYDLNPDIVHLRREGDDLREQNQQFRGRTSMRPDALDSLDFSLTLKDLQLPDSGVYICSMIDETEEEMLADVRLHVKASQDSLTTKVEVWEGAQSVVLPCHYSGELKGTVTVKWNRYDLIPNTVHRRQERDDLREQNQQFRGRTSLRRDAAASGDFSITLREPQLPDSGVYICWITDETEEIKRSDIQLSVREIFPTWSKVLLALLVLLSVSGGLLFHFRHYFISD